MRTSNNHSALLRRETLMRFDARAGEQVTCVRGMVWLTQEQDPMDWVLAAGETFACDRPGILLVNALAQDAVVEFPDPARCIISRPAPRRARSALSLAEEIGHISARMDPQTITAMPPGARRDAVEHEAKRMRTQLVWLVVQHAKNALVSASAAAAALCAHALRRSARLLKRARRRAGVY